MNTHYLFGLPFAIISVGERRIDALVDTGFNGALLLPASLIRELKLPKKSSVRYALADGRIMHASAHSLMLNWFGAKKEVDVVAADADISVLGMALLWDARTVLEPAKGILAIESA